MKHVSGKLESFVSCPHEFQAVAIVNALEDHGIRARAVGGYTSDFKAEAPGSVDVLVMSDDLEVARAALHRIQDRDNTVAWPKTIMDDVEDSNDKCMPGTKTAGQRKMIIYVGLALIILWQLAGFVFSRW